ncbi:MAG TPA: hypothetical protein VF970_15160 [Gemmatimonadales bacterium]
MPTAPPCRSLGRHCLELDVVLHVANLDDDTPAEQDALATWLLGHTERISFGEPWREANALLVNATVRVGCKYLADSGPAGRRAGEAEHRTARCLAHGFHGSLPAPREIPGLPTRDGGPDRFYVVQRGRRRAVTLRPEPPLRWALPVIEETNPCVGAPCRTADNQRGAACCRDLTLDVVLEGEQPNLLELLRARQSPYLCKVTPDGAGIAECEVISACGYLEPDGVSCTLHGRVRPDGEPAKPFVCREWPEPGTGQAGHPGCRLLSSP